MRARFIIQLFVLAAAAACSDSAGPGDNAVTVGDNSFNPSATTVDIGTTVTWTWDGSNQHNVTWAAAGGMGSPTQSSGTYTRAFDSAGDYDYYCSIHGTATSGMRGSVTVQ